MLDSIILNLRKQDWIRALIKKADVYIVGGCVRDALMVKKPKDIDIVIEGLTIDEVTDLLKVYGKTSIVGQSFSVIKFRPRFHEGEDYDIAVPRKDRKIGTGHKGFEVSTEGVTIKEDLKRRDFTINSIAVNIRTNEILDPFYGVRDIHLKLLRATDKNAFTEDPLRILRCIQFAARFKFKIEDNTLSLMRKNSHLIKEISGERILEEFEKILHKNGSTKIALDLMEESDIDKALFDKKFNKISLENFDNLDPVSFYYILGMLGHKSPYQFYTNRLKGEYSISKALQTLEKYYDRFDKSKSEDEIRWNVFIMLKLSPSLKDAEILPLNVTEIIDEMKAGKIPMKMGDIPVNGDDIMEEFPVGGSELGDVINIMYKDALMNKFNWKNREETFNYLRNINKN